MDRMKQLNAYHDFDEYELTGEQIMTDFSHFNERVGKKYRYVRKDKMNILEKVPTLNTDEKYRVLVSEKLWKSNFCGIFEFETDRNLCFFSYSLMDDTVNIKDLNKKLLD